MRAKRCTVANGSIISLFALHVAVSVAAAQPVRYRIRDLGVFAPDPANPNVPNGGQTLGQMINDLGVVAGLIERGPMGNGIRSAVLWPGDGLAHDLFVGRDPGPNVTILSLTNTGDVTIRAVDPARGTNRPALWRGGSLAWRFCS